MAGIMKSERAGWGPDAQDFRPERHLGSITTFLPTFCSTKVLIFTNSKPHLDPNKKLSVINSSLKFWHSYRLFQVI